MEISKADRRKNYCVRCGAKIVQDREGWYCEGCGFNSHNRNKEVNRFALLFDQIPDEQIGDFIGLLKELNDRMEKIIQGR